MVHAIESFKAFPNSVRNALVFLFVGWIWHYVSLYRYFFHGEVPVKQIFIGVTLCFFVARIRNWARVLCIVCNIIIVMMYISVTASFLLAGKIHYATVAGINVVLFSMAAYYLFIKESAQFFKARSPVPDSGSAEDPPESEDS